MASLPDKRFKYLQYRGFNPQAVPATVVYAISGNIVLFSATENVVVKASTIQAAEEIIRKICEAENLNWQKCEFYDLQTWVGYPHRGHGYYSLDRLELDQNKLNVKGWDTVSTSNDQDDDVDRDEQTKLLINLLTSGEEEA